MKYLNTNLGLRETMKVSLGQQTIMSYISAPKKFKILGIVHIGMEFGILATNEEGHYVRVNGSYEQNLCTTEVESAIKSAIRHGHVKLDKPSLSPSHHAKVVPIVTIRKHRHSSMPLKSTIISAISMGSLAL